MPPRRVAFDGRVSNGMGLALLRRCPSIGQRKEELSMMKLKTLAVALGALSGVALGSAREADAVEHYLIATPATQLILETGTTIPDCFSLDYAGGAFLNVGSMCVPPSGSVHTANFGLSWAPNPGSTVGVDWYAHMPTNTYLRARLRARNQDGSIYASSGWVSGAGLQGTWVSTSGGPLIVQAEMSSTALGAEPGLSYFAAQVYSS